MKVLMPYREEKTKTSLSNLFTFEERKKLSELMIKRILNILKTKISASNIYLVSPDFKKNLFDINTYKSPVDLNKSLKTAIDDLGLPVLIIPTDIPLISSENVKKLLDFDNDVIISPGENGGTNSLLLRKKIPLSYTKSSLINHLDYILKNKIDHRIYSDFNIFKDLDSAEDIKYIMKNLKDSSELKKWLNKKIKNKNYEYLIDSSTN